MQIKVISGKEYPVQRIRNFQFLPCACELKRDIYFQKSPKISINFKTSQNSHTGKSRCPEKTGFRLSPE